MVRAPIALDCTVMNVETVEQLRAWYSSPKERAVKKQLSTLDGHCRKFIELSPFVVVASCNLAFAAPTETHEEMRARCAADL